MILISNIMDKILLIDGHNFMWRANITFGKKQQEPSFTMVYNFFRGLRALIEEFQPNKVFFCLEGANNFRYKVYPEYKANRLIKKASDAEDKYADFHRQKDIIISLLKNLPINMVKADEFECDDVIATLSESLKDEEIIIISNDSDFIQLLQKDFKSLKIYNPFKKKYMVAPEYHYLTWKCLAGDKQTDNIPSIVGPKTAEKIATDINKFGEFLNNEENKSNYNLNKILIELKIIPDDCLQIFDYDTNFNIVKEQFSKMDFKSMVEEKYWDRFCGTFSNLR